MSEPTNPPAGPAGASTKGPTVVIHHGTIREVHDMVVEARGDLAAMMAEDETASTTTVAALVALAAAGPVLDLAGQLAAGVGEVGERIGAQERQARDALADRMTDDLARALDAHDVADGRELLDLVRQRVVPFGPTIPVGSLAIALGESPDVVAAGASDWGIATLLGRVRALVAAQSAAEADPDPDQPRELIDREALSERERFGRLIDALADALGLERSDADNWRSSDGIAAMLDAVRAQRENGESDERQRARELATALGYPTDRGTPTNGWDWAQLLGEVEGQVRYTREVSRNAVVDLARALGLDADRHQWGDLLNLVGQLARPQAGDATTPNAVHQSDEPPAR
jgi:hypothetical protein